jgi:hypothetical protein
MGPEIDQINEFEEVLDVKRERGVEKAA